MADLTINADDVRNALNEFAASYEPGNAERVEVGRVVSASDGIARIEGLPSVMANELLRFEDGTLGLAQNLDTRDIGVIILGDFTGIEEGQQVHRTGEVLSVPVGDKYLGRVVDPLGNPIDDLGPIEAEGRRALELQAPGVTQRKSVHEPLQTGLKAIDAMIPIGRGQRQLIIGDRQTGKTAIAVDTILNQKTNWESGDPSSRYAACTLQSGRKPRPLRRCVIPWKLRAHWSTPPLLLLPHRMPQALNTWHRTLVQRLASTGCTAASMC